MNLHYEIAAYDRRTDFGVPVQRVVYDEASTGKQQWTPYCGRFLILLRGAGTHTGSRTALDIAGPAVVPQPPGHTVRYGPRRGEPWEELIIAYSPSDWNRYWRAFDMRDGSSVVFEPENQTFFQLTVEELFIRLASADMPFQVDLIDQICSLLVLSARVRSGTPNPSKCGALHQVDAIERIRSHLMTHFREPLDLNKLIRSHGISASHFRRKWKERMSISPLRYLTNLRMNEACRRLVVSRDSIHEIAQAVGYEDAFYFSRLFHKHMGVSPKDYRKP